MASIKDYLKEDGSLQFVVGNSAENEHMVRGVYTDPDFMFHLPRNAPLIVMNDVGDALVHRGALKKDFIKWRTNNLE